MLRTCMHCESCSQGSACWKGGCYTSAASTGNKWVTAPCASDKPASTCLLHKKQEGESSHPAQLARDLAEGHAVRGVHQAAEAHDAHHRAARIGVEARLQLPQHALHQLRSSNRQRAVL